MTEIEKPDGTIYITRTNGQNPEQEGGLSPNSARAWWRVGEEWIRAGRAMHPVRELAEAAETAEEFVESADEPPYISGLSRKFFRRYVDLVAQKGQARQVSLDFETDRIEVFHITTDGGRQLMGTLQWRMGVEWQNATYNSASLREREAIEAFEFYADREYLSQLKISDL